MNQTIIGAAPDPIHHERRWRDRVNNAAPVDLAGGILLVFSNARRQLVLRSRQIGADLFPMIAAVARLPERVSGEEHEMRIEWRKNHWFRPQRSEIVRLHRDRQNALRLTGAAIEPRQLPAINDVGIDR